MNNSIYYRDNQNNFPDMVELKLVVDISSEEDLEDLEDLEEVEDCSAVEDVRLELRVTSAEIELDDETLIKVGFRNLWLFLSLDGYQPVPGPRLGEPIKEISAQKTVERNYMHGARGEVSSTFEAGVSQGGVPELKANIKASGDFEAASDKKVSLKSETIQKYIEAKPNLRWMIKSEDEKYLDGTYVSSSDTLCKVSALDGANRRQLVLAISARKSDLFFEVVTEAKRRFLATGKESVNKDRVFKALLSKILKEKANLDAAVSAIPISRVVKQDD